MSAAYWQCRRCFVLRIRVAERSAPGEVEASTIQRSVSPASRAILANRALRVLIGSSPPRRSWRARQVFIVILAIQMLDLGDSGVGYLNAAFGVGALIGALALALTGARRFSPGFLFGLACGAAARSARVLAEVASSR